MRSKLRMSCFFVVMAAVGCWAAEVRFDFESGDLQGWQVLDGDFGKLVSDRAIEHHGGRPYTKEGKWFLSTLESADGQHPVDVFEGLVESPVVVLSAPEITLKVGGGKGENIYVALCTIDGKEVVYARGGNGQSMQPRQWKVPELVGQPVFFRVSDYADKGWGHITLDEVVCQGKIDPLATAKRFKQRRREIEIEKGGTRADRLRSAIRELGQMFGTRYPMVALLENVDTVGAKGDAMSLEELAREALIQKNQLFYIET